MLLAGFRPGSPVRSSPAGLGHLTDRIARFSGGFSIPRPEGEVVRRDKPCFHGVEGGGTLGQDHSAPQFL